MKRLIWTLALLPGLAAAQPDARQEAQSLVNIRDLITCDVLNSWQRDENSVEDIFKGMILGLIMARADQIDPGRTTPVQSMQMAYMSTVVICAADPDMTVVDAAR